MKSNIDIIAFIYKTLNNFGVKQFLDGGNIYLLGTRPHNSEQSDVVVGSLTHRNEQFIHTTAMVNVFVKDLFNGKEYLPNFEKLNELSKFIMEVFRDKYFENEKIYVDIETQSLYKADNSQEYISSIRLNVRVINKN